MSATVATGGLAGGQRWRVALTLTVTLLLAYYDRLNLSLALPLIAAERHWSPEQLREYGALLMGLFYAGYGLANILLSPFAARLGPRRSLQIIICLWSLFTALGAWASQVMAVFLATRVLLGISEGVHFPMMNVLTKAWFPPTERSRANGLWISGIFLAMLSAPLALVPLMHAHGWRSGFLAMAAAGLLVCLPLVRRVIHDTPRRHPRVSAAEFAHIMAGAVTEHPPGGRPLALLARPGILLLLVAGSINNAVSLGVAGWLPAYYTTRLGVAYGDSGWPVALTQVFAIAGIVLWSLLGDRSNRRAAIAACGFAGLGLFLMLALQATALWQAVLLFGLGSFCVAAWSVQEFALLQHQLPEDAVAGTTGLYNGLTTFIGGGLGPFVSSAVLEGPASAWPLIGLAGLAAMLLALLARRIRY